MSDKTEQGNQEPNIDAMSLEELEAHIQAQGSTEDNPTETPSPKDNESEEKPSEEQAETTDSTESTEETTEDKPKEVDLKKQLEQKENQFKELQRQFTKDRQEMKLIKEQLEVLKSVAKPQAKEEGEVDPLEELRKTNVEAAELLDKVIAHRMKSLRAEYQKQLDERLKPTENSLAEASVNQNKEAFNNEVSNFLKSDLAELETEVVKVLESDLDTWTAEIVSNPKAFQKVLQQVIVNNLDKVAELKLKAKQASKHSNKNEKINAQPESKSKGSTPSSKELTDEQIKKMSYAELEKLRESGGLPVLDE